MAKEIKTIGVLTSGGALRVCFAEDQEWGVEKGAVSADGGSAFYGEL